MSDGTGPISVRDSLAGAMSELADAAPPEPIVPVVEAAPADLSAEATPPAGDAEAKVAPEGRDEKGRFAPKEPKAEASAEAPPAEKIETAPAAEPEPQETETIRIPHALPAPLKAEFLSLEPKWRDAFIRQEDSIKAFKDEQQPKAERLNRYDEIMAPRAEKFALQGIDEFTAIKTLLAAQDFLERDPLGGIQHLARSYGVNLSQAGQQPTGQQPGAEAPRSPTVDPALEAVLKPLLQQVQTLQTEILSSKQSTEAAEIAKAQSQVAEFAAKPENMYFENVRSDVARRIETGAATTLADAYEQAIWASSEIRPLLIKAQTAEANRKATEEAQRKKAAESRQSAGSVTGGPSGGAQAPRPASTGSVRDDLRAAMKETGATV